MATEATLAALAKLTQLARGRARAGGESRFRRRSGAIQGVQRHPRRSPVRLFQAAHRRRGLGRARRARQGGPGRSPARRDVRRREDQRHREARRPAHRLAQFLRQAGSRRRQGRDARGHRHAGKDAELRGGRARGTGARRARPADDGRHQYRHRRLRSRPRHGHARARALRAAATAQPLRLQRRRGGHRRHVARARSVADSVHRLIEDLHHARDDDQRERPRAPGSRKGWAKRRSATISPPSRPSSTRWPSSASSRRGCSASGTGSAAAIRSGRASGCRWRLRSGPTASTNSCAAATRSTSISAKRRSSETSRS